MVCLQDAVLFRRKRKTQKDVGLPCTGKPNVGGRKLKEKLERKKEKYLLEIETGLFSPHSTFTGEPKYLGFFPLY